MRKIWKSTAPAAHAPAERPWTRSETLALADQHCTYCLGLGLKAGRAARETVCNCVLRAIFRAAHGRFRKCCSKEKYISRVSLEANAGRQRKSLWGMKDEEYMADFCLIAQRTLNEVEHKIFRMHFLLGAEWKPCCARLKMDRGTFFHHVYRIEQKLGRAFRNTEPYPLWPADEYFGGAIRREADPLDQAFPVEAPSEEPEGKVLRFPLKAQAA